MKNIAYGLFFSLTLLLLFSLAGCAPAAQGTPDGAPTQVVVRILDLTGLANTPTSPPPPTPFPTFTPRPTATPEPTASVNNGETSTPAPTNTPRCTNQAEYLKSLAVGDNTNFHKGDSFTKVWLVKNTGTCTWDAGYTMIFAGGDLMSGPQAIPLPGVVAPGETVELRVTLIAPEVINAYSSNWLLRDAEGNVFGVGASGNDPLVVKINVPYYHGITPP